MKKICLAAILIALSSFAMAQHHNEGAGILPSSLNEPIARTTNHDNSNVYALTAVATKRRELSTTMKCDSMNIVMREQIDDPMKPLPKLIDDVHRRNKALGKDAQSQTETVDSMPDDSLDLMYKDVTSPTGTKDGQPASLSDYVAKGKCVLACFWASWNTQSAKVNAAINTVYKLYHSDRFDVVGITIEDLRLNTYRSIEQQGIEWNQIYDCTFEALKQYGETKLPFVILFDAQGKMAARGISVDNIQQEVEKLLNTNAL